MVSVKSARKVDHVPQGDDRLGDIREGRCDRGIFYNEAVCCSGVNCEHRNCQNSGSDLTPNAQLEISVLVGKRGADTWVLRRYLFNLSCNL